MNIDNIARDIRSLKIQGAENIARQAVSSLLFVLRDYNSGDAAGLVKELNKVKTMLFNSRPTEPAMRNALNFVLYNLPKNNVSEIKTNVKLKVSAAMSHFEKAKETIADIGSKKIKKGMVVYTHCHSSLVVATLLKAKSKGINFEVHNTETRPLFQGRITAQELAKAGIRVTHYVDSALRLAMKKADIVLLGADAVTAERVINKIGSELVAETAEKYQVPLYICTDSWKLDPKTLFGYEEDIEKRPYTEVWPSHPKGVKIDNHAFERIDPNLIMGIISELGIFKHSQFIEETLHKYPFLGM